ERKTRRFDRVVVAAIVGLVPGLPVVAVDSRRSMRERLDEREIRGLRPSQRLDHERTSESKQQDGEHRAPAPDRGDPSFDLHAAPDVSDLRGASGSQRPADAEPAPHRPISLENMASTKPSRRVCQTFCACRMSQRLNPAESMRAMNWANE